MLMGIVGGLGCGKTLFLTYYGYNQHQQGKRVFSNYKLLYEHTPIMKPDEIEKITRGVFLGDELWVWLDARESMRSRNKILTKIMMKSRKRGFDVIYTTQHWGQIDIRIRRVTDFLAYPDYDAKSHSCRVPLLDMESMAIKTTLIFKTSPVYQLYNTDEEIYEPTD